MLVLSSLSFVPFHVLFVPLSFCVRVSVFLCLSRSLSLCPSCSFCVPRSLLWINDSTLLIGSTCCTGSKDVPSSRWKRGSHCQQSFPQQETVFLPEPVSALFLSWLTKEPFFLSLSWLVLLCQYRQGI